MVGAYLKKIILFVFIFILCTFILFGCSLSNLIAASENYIESAYQKESAASPQMPARTYNIDPLGLLQMAFGKDINLYTASLTEEDDYRVYDMDDYKEYDFFDKEFEYLGENFYTFYNLCTPSESNAIDTVEYEIYFDAANTDLFMNHYKGFYNTLCHEFGERNIYKVSYKELDDSIDNVTFSDLDSLCMKISAFDNGGYYISWDNPEYQIYYQVIVDDQNTFSENNRRFYDVYLTFIVNNYNDRPNADPMDNIDSLVLHQ